MTGKPEVDWDAWSRALRAAMTAQGLSQDALGKRLGVAQSYVSDWLYKAEPRPERVFEIEQALGLEPGQLSHHLGYVPLCAVRSFADVRTAIERDETLTPNDRETVLRVYEAARRPIPRPRG